MLLAVASFATFAFAAAGCGGDDDSESAETAITETTTTEETETTETETTETEATETEATETTDTETTETSASGTTAENCQEFAQVGAKISGALTGTSGDPAAIKEAFDELAAAAPSEIKDDFETLAAYLQEVADALEGVDLTSTTPDPEALARLQGIDTTEVTQASTNISTWVSENCTGVTP